MDRLGLHYWSLRQLLFHTHSQLLPSSLLLLLLSMLLVIVVRVAVAACAAVTVVIDAEVKKR
jgi:hypothetical protein